MSTSLEVRPHPGRPGEYQVDQDGTLIWTSAHAEELIPALKWAINTAAVGELGSSYLLFHAASAVRNGRGILMPAISGSGKSTLVAGLAANGFQCFGDDIAVIDRSDLQLAPFVESVCVKSGSLTALSIWYPELETGASYRRWGRDLVYYVLPPETTGFAEPVPVRYVVLPQYVQGGETSLTPVSRSTAMTCLLEQSFSAGRHGSDGIAAIVEMLRGAACYALTVGDLKSAVAVLRDLTE